MNKLARRSRRHLVPAALLGAVIVATAGTGAVADQLIGSRDVTNDSLRSVDIMNETLKSRDIKNSTVRGRDVRDGSLTEADFKGGVVQGQPGEAPAKVYTWTESFTLAETNNDGGGPPAEYRTASEMTVPTNGVITAQKLRVTGACEGLSVSAFLAVNRNFEGTDLASGSVNFPSSSLAILGTGETGKYIVIRAAGYGPDVIGCEGTFSLEFALRANPEGPGATFN